jgi:hypothetical protein
VDNVRDLRLEFLTKLYFCGLESQRTERELLQAQIGVCLKNADFVQGKLESSLNLIERRAFEYRLAMIRCSITWLETMVAEADTGSAALP